MIHDHDPDRFYLEMATYLGADPDVAARATLDEVARLAAVRDGGAPAAALAQAEGLVVAGIAFLQTVVGHEDVAYALTRAAAGCRRRATLEAAVMRSTDRGSPR